MAVTRVTTQMMADRVLTNLNFQTRSLLKLQEQLASGRRINAPSDNPVDARRAVNTRTTIHKTQQYADNIAMTRPQHQETATIMQQMLQQVRRAHELTMQGANAANSQEQQNYLAEEINQVLEGVLQNANHRANGRYIFAGTRTTEAAFEAQRNASGEITGVNYMGNQEKISIAVSDSLTISINEAGDRVMQGGVDIFQALIDVRDNMRTRDVDALGNQRLNDLEAAREQLSQALSRVGAAQNRIDSSEGENEDYRLQNEALLSQILDADFAETIIDSNVQQNAYQAALGAAGRILQPSLMDYVA
jgi:flagellar hook-associated protein 3 FlgL